MKRVLIMDGTDRGRIEEVSDEAVGLRDEATGDWFRCWFGLGVDEVWVNEGPLVDADATV